MGRFSPYINAVGAMGDEGPSFTPPADHIAIRQPRGEDGGEAIVTALPSIMTVITDNRLDACTGAGAISAAAGGSTGVASFVTLSREDWVAELVLAGNGLR